MACTIDQTCGDAVYDFPCYKAGTTSTAKQFVFTVNGSPPVSNISSVELKIYRDGLEQLSLTNPDNITIDAGDRFTIDAQVFSLNPYIYQHSILVTFADGTIKGWLKGDFPVEV